MIKCLVIVVVLSSLTGAYEIAKPGCPDECGGVKIPFPFGFGSPHCYLNGTSSLDFLNHTYLIKCDHTTNPPTPFLADRNGSYKIKLLSINVEDHSLRVSSGVAFECYNITSITDNNSYNLPDIWPWNISATRNRFTAIGCDTTARVWDYLVEETGDSIGCITYCDSLEDMESRNATCSGRGCCQTPIFNIMQEPAISVGSFFNHSRVYDFNPCSYAFVGEVGSYEFSKASLTLSANDIAKIRVPVVYDWSIAFFNSEYDALLFNCSESEKAANGIFLCGTNTRCVDGDDVGGGYHCQCLEGYTGNPYLSRGCQDINECADERLNSCQKREFCFNKKGGFECECPKGFHGSGTSNNPCIPDPGSAKLVLETKTNHERTRNYIGHDQVAK